MRSLPGRARPQVAMVQAWTPQYRRGFYAGVRERLDDAGIDFRLVHGLPYGDQAAKNDNMTVPWAQLVQARTLAIGGRTLSWRPCVRLLRDADLVIAQQETALLENYGFLLAELAGRQHLAFWGHGRNFQNASPLGEAVKRLVSKRVHWWFAYNDLSATVVEDLGFPRERITVVNNAIDTRRIRELAARVTDEQKHAVREQLGIVGKRVGVYVGGLYAEKRLPFLLAACDGIRARCPEFEMVVIGSGPDYEFMLAESRARPWLHVVGPKFDSDKVRLLGLADVLLMPGLVGLVILDAFALGLPLVTVADSSHSPEIDYLRNGANGIMLPAGTEPHHYAAAVVDLLEDEVRLARLAAGGRRDSNVYTMENMVQRFSDGVVAAVRAA